jgi:hypothetical protein
MAAALLQLAVLRLACCRPKQVKAGEEIRAAEEMEKCMARAGPDETAEKAGEARKTGGVAIFKRAFHSLELDERGTDRRIPTPEEGILVRGVEYTRRDATAATKTPPNPEATVAASGDIHNIQLSETAEASTNHELGIDHTSMNRQLGRSYPK